MKYVPRLPKGNVNVSSTHPLWEVAWIVGGLLLLLLIFYALLGLLVEWAASSLPVEGELWIGRQVTKHLNWKPNAALQRRLDALVATLPPDSPLHRYPLTVYLDENDGINAFALPGGTIVVLRGLLDQVGSENELAMVLAHELGHFAARDHLKAMGRNLLVAAAAWLLSGNQETTSRFITRLATNIETRYSRKQEEAADTFGLALLAARYGHCGGATDFFSRLAAHAPGSRISYFLASHPHPADRVRHLEHLIKEQHCAKDKTEPLTCTF